MPRREKPEEPGPSKAYLVSFGDTMTTLLAFFIVLCSLAEDQTGFNLYRGTGSFIKSIDGFGLPGPFPSHKSSRTFQAQATSPLYLAGDAEAVNPDRNASGPDENDNGLRSINRGEDELKRFLNEMERTGAVDIEPAVTGEVTFDFFTPLNARPPVLPAAYGDILGQVIPQLRRQSHRVELVVWATTPAPSAWTRAARQARRVHGEISRQGKLDVAQRRRLRAVAKPWIHRDVRRPVLSITTRRVTAVKAGASD